MYSKKLHCKIVISLLVTTLTLVLLLPSCQAQTEGIEHRYSYTPQWPVESSDRTITYTYAQHGGDAVSYAGLDIWSSANRDIRTSMGGKVISSGWNSSGYGFWVVIETNIGVAQYRLTYAHLREASPWEVGWEIDQGQFIGYMGNTGNSTPINGDGTHLHFEVDRDGSGIDPQRFINEGVTEIDVTPRF